MRLSLTTVCGSDEISRVRNAICIMTSYKLTLTVVVVDPRRRALVCRTKGGKQAGKQAGQKRYWDEHDKNNVAHGSHGGKCPRRLVYFKKPQNCSLRLADDLKFSYRTFVIRTYTSWRISARNCSTRCSSCVNTFQQADFNFSGTARHFMLPNLTPSLATFGNGLNRRMNVLLLVFTRGANLGFVLP